ncbi:MAG: zinc finger domain-containing protein [Stackebrandtia sp.]
MARRCPFCGAAPGADCTRPGTRGPTATTPHPSRYRDDAPEPGVVLPAEHAGQCRAARQ